MTSPILTLDLPPDHPLRMILDVIETHPEVREPLLRVLLTERFLALPDQVDKLQSDFEEFRDETRARFDGIDQRLVENTGAIRRLEGHVGRLVGASYEDLCRAEIAGILDDRFDKPVIANRDWINERLLAEGHGRRITREEYLDGLRPDIIACGADDNGETGLHAVIEASVTFNQADLRNAARRAGLISRVMGFETAAFVVTNSDWPPDVDELAQQLGVTIIHHTSPDHA